MSNAAKPSRWGIRRHGRAFLNVGLISAVGIAATMGFQILTGRFLGPEAYGLLAAFMAIVGIAATGSSALQNSVAVGAARAKTHSSIPVQQSAKRWDSSLIEALALGSAITLAIFIAAPFLATMLKTGTGAILMAGCTVLPAFLLSRALGILQGNGSSNSVAGWTSGGQAFRLALACGVIALSLGAVSLLIAILASTVAITVGAGIQAKRTGLRPEGIAFSKDTIVVLLLIISFAWLTNIEVVLVRGGTPELISGSFAAAAVLTKTIFIVPGMMSVYLLPRFVANAKDSRNSQLGVTVSLGIIALGGLVAFMALLFIAEPVTTLLFGSSYSLAATYLPWMALAYLPWALSQGLLIRLTAIASKLSLGLLLIASVVEWVTAMAVLPDIWEMIALIGWLGLAVLAGLLAAHFMALKSPSQITVSHEKA